MKMLKTIVLEALKTRENCPDQGAPREAPQKG